MNMGRKLWRGVVILAAVGLAGALGGCPAKKSLRQPKGEAAAVEKLLLGFEKTELEQGSWVVKRVNSGTGSWFYHLEQADGLDFAAHFEVGGTNRVWTWRCRTGEHTEGDLALVSAAGPPAAGSSYQKTKFLSHYYPFWRKKRKHWEAWPIMSTFQWLVKARGDLRDWSGYELLRVDIYCEKEPVKVWLAVEDDLIEPPVVRIYRVPRGKWQTLELDLTRAVAEREMDLTRMTNFWLMGSAAAKTGLRVDNIRLAKKGAPSSHPLLRDDSSMRLYLERPKRIEAPGLKAGTPPPDRSPVELGEPVIVAEGAVAPWGWVSAYDNNRLLLAYIGIEVGKGLADIKGLAERRSGKDIHNLSVRDYMWLDGKDPRKVVASRDGGKTWTTLPSPTIYGFHTARGSVVDERGDAIAISSGPGCCGIGGVGPRQHLTKYTFTGKTWEARLPAAILDCDIRHCSFCGSVVRLKNGPYRGRLWAVWGTICRDHAMGVHAKYSDDDGKTWFPWGKGALIPGSKPSEWRHGTYFYPEAWVTPYRDHVACFWRAMKEGCPLMWSYFDGKKWTPPSAVSPADPGDTIVHCLISAVTVGREEIFATASNLPGVLRWDGRRWRRDLKAPGGGLLTVCGGKTVMYFVIGEGKFEQLGHAGERTPAGKLQYYRRRSAGRWDGPFDLVKGKRVLHRYGVIPGLVVPPCSPANFVPVAWTEVVKGRGKVVKFLKVPVR